MEQENGIRTIGDIWRSQHLFVVLFLAICMMLLLLLFTFYSGTQEGRITPLPPVTMLQNEAVDAVRAVTQRHRQSAGPYRVGIISGHRGSDPGAVCPDGLREADINQRIADLVEDNLVVYGIETTMLDEFDNRLTDYTADVLVSLHADSCDTQLSGYKAASADNDHSRALQICIERNYGEGTGLSYHYNTITPSMTLNHIFRKVAPSTPAVILEMGFLDADRALLVDAYIPAEAITQGVLCYLNAQ